VEKEGEEDEKKLFPNINKKQKKKTREKYNLDAWSYLGGVGGGGGGV